MLILFKFFWDDNLIGLSKVAQSRKFVRPPLLHRVALLCLSGASGRGTVTRTLVGGGDIIGLQLHVEHAASTPPNQRTPDTVPYKGARRCPARAPALQGALQGKRVPLSLAH